MDNAQRRAAERAANKLLAAAGYDLAGLSLRVGASKKLAKKRAQAKATQARQKKRRRK